MIADRQYTPNHGITLFKSRPVLGRWVGYAGQVVGWFGCILLILAMVNAVAAARGF